MIQVAEQDFNIDPDFFNMLIERSKAKIEETKKEEQWEVEKNTVTKVSDDMTRISGKVDG